MSEMTEKVEHTSWWAVCDDCLATIRVESHPERETPVPSPDEDEWDSLSAAMSCPVCGGRIYWNSDPQRLR